LNAARNGTSAAAVIAAPGQVRTAETQLGAVEAGRVRVRVSGCGICGSNLPVWEGRPWFDYPMAPGAPGHEGWGVVENGSGASAAWTEGQPVAFLHEQAFQEVIDVPADRLVALPAALEGVDFPGEAIGCGFNVARRARFEAGQKVAVVGAGFLGSVVVAAARRAGAEVLAISRRPTARRMAEIMGATETLALTDQDEIVGEVERLTRGDLCDVVVEAVGQQEPLDLAGRLTGFGGRLVVAGFHQDGRRQVDMQLWNWRGIDVINAHERDPQVSLDGIRDAALAACDWFDPSPLYTHRFPLARMGEGMEMMRRRPEGFVKALVLS
jgi:threonine dehydrogenase-like Zn-dependent dehydrogenase